MLKRVYALLMVVWCLSLVAYPAYAHHAAAAEFDLNKAIRLKGVLTKVEWINPHTYFYFDVPGAGGKVATWQIFMSGTAQLRRAGLTNKQMLAVGQTYTLTGSPARDGSTAAIVNEMVFPDGRVFRFRSETASEGR